MMAEKMKIAHFFQCFCNNLKVTLFLTTAPPLKYDEIGYSRILQDLGENKKISHRQDF